MSECSEGDDFCACTIFDYTTIDGFVKGVCHSFEKSRDINVHIFDPVHFTTEEILSWNIDINELCCRLLDECPESHSIYDDDLVSFIIDLQGDKPNSEIVERALQQCTLSDNLTIRLYKFT